MSHICEFVGCVKRSTFNHPGLKARRCTDHKIEGDVDVNNKICESPNCKTQANFSQNGDKAKRCAKHKKHGDINVTSKTCEHNDCSKIPTFSQIGDKAKRCVKHMIDGDVDVKSRICEYPYCMIHPSFSQSGDKAKRCSKHRIDGDVNVIDRTCEYQGCNKIPNFSHINQKKAIRCSKHRIQGDVDVKSKKCEYPDCQTIPNFAKPGRRGAKRCSIHRIDRDVDVKSKRCSSKACSVYDKYERAFARYNNPDLCTNCHRALYPEFHRKLTVRKEQFVLAEIQRQIPELEEYFLVWDCRLNNCTLKKPDMAWRVKDTLLHVEIDEGGCVHEDNLPRLLEIHAVSGLKNHVLIRFNPDRSEDGDEPCLKKTRTASGEQVFKLYEPSWNHRIPVLIDSIRVALCQALENVNVDTSKRKLFF